MLPRSCLRLADSKSNSSTRFPRTTTTRVSSGWVASMSILLAIANSSWGAPARGAPTRTAPRRAAPRGARQNDGRGGLSGRGPNRAVQRASDPPRAALYRRVGGGDVGSRAIGPWPLTCDGRQQRRRDSLHADGRWRSTAPCAQRKRAVARLPVVLQWASAGPASRQRIAPGEGRRPPA